MARFDRVAGSIPTNLAGSFLRNILNIAACVVICAWAQIPALAQHAGVHTGGGGRVGGGVRMGAPAGAAMPRPRFVSAPHGVGPHGLGFRQGPTRVFRHRVFFGAPFFRFGPGFRYGAWEFNSLWWPNCGPSVGWMWGWAGGFDCPPTPSYRYGFENYVTLPTYENPEYLYGGAQRDLIWLYQKDGTVYSVTDYWFVNGDVHYSMFEEGATQPREHVFPLDELDVEKTKDVNTRRGFRIVFRDEPWEQYLKDHPDQTPPDAPPSPQKK